MKNLIRAGILLFALAAMSFTCIKQTQPKIAPVENPTPEEPGLILLELFTSQGCSSCPPADRVLAELATEADAGDLPVVALSYHVDYWNRLGWADPYSQAQFSDRQRAYAQKLADQRVYTPQLIVQGRSGHVGSREREIRAAIRQAQNTPPLTNIELRVDRLSDSSLSLHYHLSGRTNDLFLHVALVEGKVDNEVPRGENRGRHLSHRQVVRSFHRITTPDSTGSFSLDISVLDQSEDGQIVVFAQDIDNWEVLGVCQKTGISGQ